MRVIVAGTRTFDDYELLDTKLTKFFQNLGYIEICHANAKGADKIGEWWSYKNRKVVKIFHPDKKDKDRMGKSCAHIKEMIEYADAAIIFWDGCSDGSKRLIDHCKEAGLQVRVIRYSGGGFSSYYRNTEKYKCRTILVKKKKPKKKPKIKIIRR